MEQKTINYKGSKLSFRVQGDGQPLVFVHGFGEDGRIWQNIWDEFPGHRLIIPDLPGSGESEAIEDMSMEGMAEALRLCLIQGKFLKDEGSDTDQKCVMIGHSMGGYITLAFVEKNPEMLAGFGLFHSTSSADSTEKKAMRKKSIDFVERAGAAAFLSTAIPGLYSSAFQQGNGNIINEHVSSQGNFLTGSIVSYYTAMMQRPARNYVLEMSKVPVFILLGRNDATVSVKEGLLLGTLPRILYIHILENSGHMGMVEESRESVDHLHSYLRFVNDIQLT